MPSWAAPNLPNATTVAAAAPFGYCAHKLPAEFYALNKEIVCASSSSHATTFVATAATAVVAGLGEGAHKGHEEFHGQDEIVPIAVAAPPLPDAASSSTAGTQNRPAELRNKPSFASELTGQRSSWASGHEMLSHRPSETSSSSSTTFTATTTAAVAPTAEHENPSPPLVVHATNRSKIEDGNPLARARAATSHFFLLRYCKWLVSGLFVAIIIIVLAAYFAQRSSSSSSARNQPSGGAQPSVGAQPYVGTQPSVGTQPFVGAQAFHLGPGCRGQPTSWLLGLNLTQPCFVDGTADRCINFQTGQVPGQLRAGHFFYRCANLRTRHSGRHFPFCGHKHSLFSNRGHRFNHRLRWPGLPRVYLSSGSIGSTPSQWTTGKYNGFVDNLSDMPVLQCLVLVYCSYKRDVSGGLVNGNGIRNRQLMTPTALPEARILWAEEERVTLRVISDLLFILQGVVQHLCCHYYRSVRSVPERLFSCWRVAWDRAARFWVPQERERQQLNPAVSDLTQQRSIFLNPSEKKAVKALYVRMGGIQRGGTGALVPLEAGRAGGFIGKLFLHPGPISQSDLSCKNPQWKEMPLRISGMFRGGDSMSNQLPVDYMTSKSCLQFGCLGPLFEEKRIKGR
ncbi:hypothetical protein BDZ88DRAFT_492306 [Geranomyces variabilis]|nr:hypothetical protein BDZ88DRAFT_492306 [Geranomyces variabilis]